MKFLIKFASRGRKIAFAAGIDNIHQTFIGNNLQILVSADSNDPEMNNEDIQKHCARYPAVRLIYGESKSKIDAINRDMMHADPWDTLVNFSDDMHFSVRGWNEVMEQQIKEIWGESLDFFAHYNDGFVGEGLPTMSIMGRDYYKRDNFIYFPGYKSFSCDADAMYVAMARRRWHYFPKVLFFHQHPANVKKPNDETYHKNSLASPHDEKIYWERLHNDFMVKQEGAQGPFPWDIHKKY